MGNGSSSSKGNSRPISVGVLTVSDRGSRGEYEDLSGPAVQKLVLESLDAEITCAEIVPDERAAIRDTLCVWVDHHNLDLILTTGGTGFAPRDVTPEATADVIERDAPGFAEAMRSSSLQRTPHAMLSRARAGIRARTLIINLPGSPRAATENLQYVLVAIPHAIELLQEVRGADTRHTFGDRH